MLRLLLIPAIFSLVLILATGCAETAPGPTQSPFDSLRGPAPGDTAAASTAEQAQEQRLDCGGAEAIEEIRSEYAANHLRARETYVGQRLCLRGIISGIHENERYGGVTVAAAGGVEVGLAHLNRDEVRGSSEELNSWRAWRAWMMESSVGDAVTADCEITGFVPQEDRPRSAPGTPILKDCKRVVDGTLWTPPPTPTPTPAPTSACIPAEFGDPDTWLSIDCPAKRVTLGGVVAYAAGNREFQLGEHGVNLIRSLADSGATIIAFYFLSATEVGSDDLYRHHSPWKGWIEESRDESRDVKRMSFTWEAPPDIAAIIISEWRRGTAVQLSVVAGDCCYIDMFYDLTQPRELPAE